MKRQRTHALLELLRGTLGDPLPPSLASILFGNGASINARLWLLLAQNLDLDPLLGVGLNDTVDAVQSSAKVSSKGRSRDGKSDGEENLLDARQVNLVGVERSDRHDLLGLNQGHLGRPRHHSREVVRGVAVRGERCESQR